LNNLGGGGGPLEAAANFDAVPEFSRLGLIGVFSKTRLMLLAAGGGAGGHNRRRADSAPIGVT
jgi:hypothetical protein